MRLLHWRSERRRAIAAALLLAVVALTVAAVFAKTEESRFPGANHIPRSKHDWEKFQLKPDPDGPKDEPAGGKTARGTPVYKRIVECFPAEPRNVFWQVDQVASDKPGGALRPLNYDSNNDTQISDQERDAIRGQNTWMLWGEGNEAFWGWLQEQGYGLTDLLIMLDSRNRDTRFKDFGLINQPGFKKNDKETILGLYIDQNGTNSELTGPPNEIAKRPTPPANHPKYPFPLGDKAKYDNAVSKLPHDGLDTSVYGYPSGVVGLRLFPNPDFFGNTEAAAQAREHWQKQVESNSDAYYNNAEVNADPNLVRPFRPSMACAFCHVGPHPLSPPGNPEAPEWKDLSSTIGNQYWKPQKAFANLTKERALLYHFLRSQQPGTIDTSLVSTDHINNSNTITAIFEVPGRLERAAKNPPEKQSGANLLQTAAEDGNPATNPRHTPRVLLDGADSIGVLGALSRVYLNIGTFPEQWSQCHNPLIGFKPQKPFTLAACDAHSVWWQTAQKYRTGYLAAFFTMKPAVDEIKNAGGRVAQPYYSTGAMKLSDAPGGAKYLTDTKSISEGRGLFLEHCAVCHSSKQPDNFAVTFSRDWQQHAQDVQPGAPLVMPMDFAEWELFKHSAAYTKYTGDVKRIANADIDKFFEGNYLSTDIRVPITLVGSNSGRAVATNGMRGQVWDNFSSEDYKNLPAVGPIRFYNPYSNHTPDALGLNDVYYPPGGGPGYYRPASLVSLWATAPFLHNNTLGDYSRLHRTAPPKADDSKEPDADPSVNARVKAFEDGIDKLLHNAIRSKSDNRPYGDLRADAPELTGHDPGFIYRTPVTTYFEIHKRFIFQFLAGVTHPLLVVGALAALLWLGIYFLALALTPSKHGPAQFRPVALVWVIPSVVLILIATGLIYELPVVQTTFALIPPVWNIFAMLGALVAWLLVPLSLAWFALKLSNRRNLAFASIVLTAVLLATVFLILQIHRLPWALLLWLIPALLIGQAIWLWRYAPQLAGRTLLTAGLLTLTIGCAATAFVDGMLCSLELGPFPKGMPINLVMNLNPEAPLNVLVEAVCATTRGIVLSQFEHNEANALHAFEAEAGPPLLKASKCPDFVLDRGHWFGETLSESDKQRLKAFLRTL